MLILLKERITSGEKCIGMFYSYCLEDERGVMPEVEFIFDLELPFDFKPVNADGEVEGFQLLPVSKVNVLLKLTFLSTQKKMFF
jgi:hypothetical protein